MASHLKLLLGRTVHFPDSTGVIHQGEILAAWLEPPTGIGHDHVIQVSVLCRDRKYRHPYLENVTDGAVPREDKK